MKYNTLTRKEYDFYIENEKKKKVNILGMYRSILENEKLSKEEKVEVRELLNKDHFKTYEFYQIKYPQLYIELFTLDKDMNDQQLEKLREEIRNFQERKLKEKKIKHRNFGDYSKHNCGMSECPMNGRMIKQGSPSAEKCMTFKSDSKNRYYRKKKYKREKINKNNY